MMPSHRFPGEGPSLAPAGSGACPHFWGLAPEGQDHCCCSLMLDVLATTPHRPRDRLDLRGSNAPPNNGPCLLAFPDEPVAQGADPGDVDLDEVAMLEVR